MLLLTTGFRLYIGYISANNVSGATTRDHLQKYPRILIWFKLAVLKF